MASNEYMTEAEFKVSFPEFRSIWTNSDEMLTAYLSHAQHRIDCDVFGNKANQAHGLLTAHTLAVAPGGQMARLVSKEGDTTYGMQYRQIMRETVLGVVVSGGAGPLPSCQ